MKKYRVLVVGAGRIGAFFDSPKSRRVLTHAHAYRNHSLCDLVGFVDQEYSQAVRAAKVWGGHAFQSIRDAFCTGPIDIVSVSASTPSHAAIMMELAKTPVRGILLEKPIALTVKEANLILRAYARKETAVVVNYTRRFLKEFQAIRTSIQNGLYGAFVAAHCYYSGGLLNNGSHFLDLLHFFFGEMVGGHVVLAQRGTTSDPRCNVVVKMRNGRCAYLISADQQSYSIFDMEFIFERRKIVIHDSAHRIDEYLVRADPLWKGYFRLQKKQSLRFDYSQAMTNALCDIIASISEKRPKRSSLRDAYTVQMECALILKKCL